MKLTLRSDDENRGWPGHLFWGRVRTSTAVLLIAFFGTAWLYETYKPPEPAEQSTQVVPPGFVPDPAYTWVPRTKVWTTTPTTTAVTTDHHALDPMWTAQRLRGGHDIARIHAGPDVGGREGHRVGPVVLGDQ